MKDGENAAHDKEPLLLNFAKMLIALAVQLNAIERTTGGRGARDGSRVKYLEGNLVVVRDGNETKMLDKALDGKADGTVINDSKGTDDGIDDGEYEGTALGALDGANVGTAEGC